MSVEWDVGKEGYFFWDESDNPIGYWPTKEQAEEEFEKHESSSNIRIL